jgi:hypothetical protein
VVRHPELFLPFVIGVLIGIALINAHHIGQAVDWGQIWNVLRALAVSPVLGPRRRRATLFRRSASGARPAPV